MSGKAVYEALADAAMQAALMQQRANSLRAAFDQFAGTLMAFEDGGQIDQSTMRELIRQYRHAVTFDDMLKHECLLVVARRADSLVGAK